MKKITYYILALVGIAAVVVVIARATYSTNFPLDLFVNSRASSAAVNPIYSPQGGTTSGVVLGTETSVVATIVAKKDTALNYPLLVVPSVGINAHMENVGIDSAGNMDVPPHLAYVGWYEYGTQIGDVGSAVIAGHVDNGLGFPAVFFKLKQLKVGDDVFVTANRTDQLHFVVTDVSNYPLVTAPSDSIFNDKSGDRIIRLITCDKVMRSDGTYGYDNRIVVTAKLVS